MTYIDHADANDFDQDGWDLRARLLDRVHTGSWLQQQQFPPMQWAVPGVLPEGFGLVAGAPKVGKSFMVLGIAIAVASGGVALGHIDLRYPPRPVLYLALEDGPRRLQERSHKLLQGRSAIPNFLHTVTDVYEPAQVEALIRFWLEDHAEGHPLVILDTLGKVMPPARAGETTYSRDYRIGGQYLALSKEFPGCTIWVVHHTRKVASHDWMDMISGTNGLNGSADFTLLVQRDRGKPNGRLFVTGRDVEEGEYAVHVNEHMQWSLDGTNLHEAAAAAQEESATEGLGDRSVEIVRYVTHHPGASPTEIGNDLGMKASAVGTYLERLIKSNRIVKLRRGKYGPVPTEASTLPVERVESVETAIQPYGHSSPVDGVATDPDSTGSTVSTPTPRVRRGASQRHCPKHGTTPDPTCQGCQRIFVLDDEAAS